MVGGLDAVHVNNPSISLVYINDISVVFNPMFGKIYGFQSFADKHSGDVDLAVLHNLPVSVP